MGYFIKDLDNIAKITEPAKFSLSDNPSFVTFKANKRESSKITFTLTITGVNFDDSYFIITEVETGIKHYFSGTTWYPGEVSESDNLYFFQMDEPELIAQNIAFLLKRSTFFSKYYDVSVKSHIIQLTSKDTSSDPACLFKYSIPFEPTFDWCEPSEDPQFVTDRVDIDLKVVGDGLLCIAEGTGPLDPIWCMYITKFTITESRTKTPHLFEGTFDISSIGGGVFYMGEPASKPTSRDLAIIAENLKNCLQDNDFMGRNFDISIPLVRDNEGKFEKGTIIKIRAKGDGEDYAFSLTPNVEEEYIHFFYE